MDTTNAFAVPRMLFAGRKRSAVSSHDPDRSCFFTFNDFAMFSTRGDAHESRLYGELETRRQTLVTTIGASKFTRTSSSIMKIKKTRKHLVQLLVDALERHRIQAPEKMLELDNARRRVSTCSVDEHEHYLMLQRKLLQAQQRGLPEVLALAQDEAKQWQKIKTDVENEQAEFCRIMTRGLASEAAVNETHVPPFAESWYNAMLAQCWSDIYRLYPRWFAPCMTIKLLKNGVPNSLMAAVIETKEVASRGICCTINLAKLLAGQPLKSTPDESEGRVLDVTLPRQVISVDAQAEQLMETYDCDIAISSSTLVTLFDSDTLSRFAHVPAGWSIPMKSRASDHETIRAKKRIYLDRPLPGSNPGTREKVAEAGRAALLSRFEEESMFEGSTGGRTSYQVLQLDEMRILVRSSTHVDTLSDGALLSANVLQDEQHKQATAPLSIFVKPDYHLLGVEEQLTTSERCRFWFHSWLRGGSAVIVVRVNPKKDIISSWKTYSPTSLVFGDNSEQCLPLECFDSSSKFQWLSVLFASLVDLPVGNYLVRPQDEGGPSTFGSRRAGVEVLMATAEPGAETSGIDLYGFMPTTNDDGVAASSNIFSVLPAWNLCDRIPYTFQTGVYCLPFFLEAICPKVSKGESCEHIHLRLPKQSESKRPMKAKRWRFDNYTIKRPMKATANIMWDRPWWVTMKYRFCGEDKAPPFAITVKDLYAPVHCSKRSSECSLPHLTLHQILERVADDVLRKERKNRRVQKGEHKQQPKVLKASNM